jgi:hypothetical protein
MVAAAWLLVETAAQRVSLERSSNEEPGIRAAVRSAGQLPCQGLLVADAGPCSVGSWGKRNDWLPRSR